MLSRDQFSERSNNIAMRLVGSHLKPQFSLNAKRMQVVFLFSVLIPHFLLSAFSIHGTFHFVIVSGKIK